MRSSDVNGVRSAASTAPDADVSSASPPIADTAQLTAALYEELCAMAHRLRRAERDEHTLQTAALVHEAFLRLAQQHAAAWRDRPYFLAAAANTMRRVLVDYARERGAAKRGRAALTTLFSWDSVGNGPDSGDALDVLAFNDILERLAALDERKARVVELRVFGGFDMPEIAEIIGISRNTATRDWRFAKGWLACQLGPNE
ncbi:MAG: ECF-type sigma factor [Gemmatimonadaceae bacterium]